MQTRILTATLLGLAMTSSTASSNDVFVQGSILVSTGNAVHEYDAEGVWQSQLPIPANAGQEMVRDIVVLDDGRLAVFNGTFNPELSIFDGASWTTYSVDGWSTVNNVSYGGIASIADEIFLTDGYTYGGGEAQGLVSIDSNSGDSFRFASHTAYIDITVGGDGLLYALQNTYGDLDVIDPSTLEIVRAIDLGHLSGSRGVAVNEDGEIYMASWDGYVAHFDAQGVVLNTLSMSNNLTDIDMNSAGRIVVGNRIGDVYQTNADLSSFSVFSAGSDSVFVAFIPVSATNPPSLSGSRSRKGRYITTTLSWTSDASSVDVYYNGTLIDTLDGVSTAVYRYSKKQSQRFQVCTAGTDVCSEEYIAN